MIEKHSIGINNLLNKHDQNFAYEAIIGTIQEHLCEEDELVNGIDYQINVTYQTETDNSSSDWEEN